MLPIWTFQASSTHSPATLERILFDLPEGDVSAEQLPLLLEGKGKCRITKEGDHYTILYPEGHKSYVHIDRSARSISIQGEWWYRGVYILQPEGSGTHIMLQVYNIAPKMRWIASLMIRRQKSHHEMEFRILLEKAAERIKQQLHERQ